MTDCYISYAAVQHRFRSIVSKINLVKLRKRSIILLSTISFEFQTEKTTRHTEGSGRNFYDISFCGPSMELLPELLFRANSETRLCKASVNENNAVRPSRLQFHCSCTKCFGEMLTFLMKKNLNGPISVAVNILDRKNEDVKTKTKVFMENVYLKDFFA